MKVSSTDPLSTCRTNYRHSLNEGDMRYDMSANDIGRAWLAGLSNTIMKEIYVLSEKLDIRYGLKTLMVWYNFGNHCSLKRVVPLPL